MDETGSFLVIGSGLAGLSFALRIADQAPVTVITKDTLKESNSSYAQGGIAAVLGPLDDYETHIKDTLQVGQGLCDPQAVEHMVRRGPEELDWLMEFGVEFDTVDGQLDLSREGGHSRRRVVHAGDVTGNEVQRVLIERAEEHPNVELFENITAIDLIVDSGVCLGITALDEERARIIELKSDNTVLSTGGSGQLYAKTSNPMIATGDGVAMAWRAGAEVKDMEFIQFHPSILDKGESPYFLVSETVRGEGGILLNSLGEAFMTRYHALQDLAPRDVVSRAIVEEQRHGQVYIDIRHRGRKYLLSRFPRIYEECLSRGVRMDEDLIPVSPAAHYMCGGVRTNLHGETNVKGLYAVGECACTGVHGANRLASNSTLECMVFAHNAAEKIQGAARAASRVEIMEVGSCESEPFDTAAVRASLQRLMWTKVGINRSLGALQEAVTEIKAKRDRYKNLGSSTRESVEFRNLLDVAGLVAVSAYTRRESRGTHYLENYPLKDNGSWLKHIVFSGVELRFENVNVQSPV